MLVLLLLLHLLLAVPSPLVAPTVHNGNSDDTALLDALASAGGLIELQPRTYHHTGDWVLSRNHTTVRGAGVGLTKLVMHSGTVLARSSDSNFDPYSHQYSYDKPLNNFILEDLEVALVQNVTLDAEGHCCTFHDPHGSAVQLVNVAHGALRRLRVHGADFQSISLVNCAGVRVEDCHSSWCCGTDIAINDFSMDCQLINPLVTTEDFPAGTNFSGQYYKDDALAIQGYTRGCSVRGGTVRLAHIQTEGGAAGIKIAGSDNVHVQGVLVEGHANTLTLDYSQYTAAPHSNIIIADLIGINPKMNGLNLAGSNSPNGPFTAITITNIHLERSTPPPYPAGTCVPWGCNITGNCCAGGSLCSAGGVGGSYECCAPTSYATGNAVNVGWVDRLQLNGLSVNGHWGVGVHFVGGAGGINTPNDYQIAVVDATLDGVDTAFAFASATDVFTRSSTRDVVVRNGRATAAGPGAAAAIAIKARWFEGLREYNVTRPIDKDGHRVTSNPALKTDDSSISPLFQVEKW